MNQPQETQLQTTQSLQPSEPSPVVLWSQERLNLLKSTVAAGLSNNEFMLFVEVCKRRRLDPFAKQIYAVRRGDRVVHQTSIDGYRLIAERTGRYLGQTNPEWCDKTGKWVDIWTQPGPPFACRIGVYKDGHAVPTVGIAYWETYYSPGPFWKKAGPHMLAKCAEALALRKAFPEELSGLYTNDEMSMADTDTMVAEPVMDGGDPVLIFPIIIVSTWTAQGEERAIAKDSNGDEWMFSAVYFPALDAAITDGTPNEKPYGLTAENLPPRCPHSNMFAMNLSDPVTQYTVCESSRK
jgi:phage recombination protein Bet